MAVLTAGQASTQEQSPPSTRGRFAGLDGIRGIAAALVVLTHVFPHALYKETLLAPIAYVADFGWLGVELFFVLSGFLITGILRANRTATNYFRAFYWHRTLRVFPLYFLLVALCLLVIPVLAPQKDQFLWIHGQSAYTLPYWLFLSNLGCCIDVSPHSLLLVCWSLAIEEQFYLLWSLCVYRLSTRTLTLLALNFVVLCPLLRWYLPAAGLMSPAEAFYFTFAHFDSLAFGALASILYDTQRDLARRLGRLWMAWLVPFIAVCMAAYQSVEAQHTAYRVPMMLLGYSAAGLLFSSMILYLITRASALRQVLELRPFRTLGDISYFTYLFHLVARIFPLYVFADPMLRFLETAVVVVVAGLISFRFIESPILRLKKLIPYRFAWQARPA